MIELQHPELSIRRQCELLGLNRATLYYEPAQESALNLELMRRIDTQYLKTPFCGYRRMTVCLCEQGFSVNPKRIQRLMHTVMGIQAVYPKPRTTVASAEHSVYPYLLCNLAITHPNQVWSTDGRPFGRLVNTSLDVTHRQGWVSSPWRSGEPSNSGSVSFQGTRASCAKEADLQNANVQERMGWD